MSSDKQVLPSRREFLQATGGLAAASLLPKFGMSFAHSGSDETIKVALVGCGGRGSGAAVNAVNSKGATLKLVAMADVFGDRLNSSFENLKGSIADKMDVPKERQFLGFDAYKHAMDALRPGDIVILTTPPAFRWVHFTYAIQKKLNVFMEKPVTVDGPSSRKMLALADEADKAGLKVGVGLMSRHSKGMQELYKRIQDGEIGDISYMRAYRMHGPAASFESTPKPDNMSHLEYQIRRFHSFLWASGGCYNDFYIHLIDQCNWMKGALPVKAQALGGRHYRTNDEGVPFIDQNFDSYAVEYVYADGTRMFFDGRCVPGAHGIYSSHIHGTKGMAVCSRANDCGGPSGIYSSQNPTDETAKWIASDRSNPYQNEWDALVDAIKNNKPWNEVKRGVEASMVSNLGRMAAHTAQEISYEDMLNCEHEFGAGIDKLTSGSDSPLMPGPDGKYPVPKPGQLQTEY